MFWHLVGTENIAQNDTESGDTEIKDLVMVLKTCNMVTIWIPMKEIYTKCSGNKEKNHLSCQKEVWKGYRKKIAFVLRSKGQFSFKSYCQLDNLGESVLGRENSTNKGECQAITLNNSVL